MTEGYYGPVNSAQDVMYERMAALDDGDVCLEDWPNKVLDALDRFGYVVVPKELPVEVLAAAAIHHVFETGNPKHGWDFLLNKVSSR